MTTKLGPPPVEGLSDVAWARVERNVFSRMEGTITNAVASARDDVVDDDNAHEARVARRTARCGRCIRPRLLRDEEPASAGVTTGRDRLAVAHRRGQCAVVDLGRRRAPDARREHGARHRRQRRQADGADRTWRGRRSRSRVAFTVLAGDTTRADDDAQTRSSESAAMASSRSSKSRQARSTSRSAVTTSRSRPITHGRH